MEGRTLPKRLAALCLANVLGERGASLAGFSGFRSRQGRKGRTTTPLAAPLGRRRPADGHRNSPPPRRGGGRQPWPHGVPAGPYMRRQHGEPRGEAASPSAGPSSVRRRRGRWQPRGHQQQDDSSAAPRHEGPIRAARHRPNRRLRHQIRQKRLPAPGQGVSSRCFRHRVNARRREAAHQR